MHQSHEFLRNLALVLGAAAAATIVFQRLRLPVVFGYLVAGMIVGPHLPIPLLADERMVQTLSELGVILVLFALGLQFSLRKLLRVGPAAAMIAVLETSAMMALGYLAGRAFGWTTLESVYAGALVAISSTTIIAKAFDEQRPTGRFTQVVFGILVVEDLIAIFLLAALTAASAGAGLSAGTLASTAGRLGAFLIGALILGILAVPRLIRLVVRLDRPETTVVTAVGLCFAASYLALTFGYPAALGAFVAGSLVAESGRERGIERLVRPVRDVFAAIFFVAVGMLIDPLVVAEHWAAVAGLALVVIAGKVTAVSAGAFLAGHGTRTSVQAGMSLAQIGEFSFIIAGVGLASGATRDFLYPVAVAVSAITTLATPWLIRSAGPVASYVDRKLPPPLQTLVVLYGSWMARLRSTAGDRARLSRERRLAALVALDAILLVAIGFALYHGLRGGVGRAARAAGIGEHAVRGLLIAIAVVAGAPLAVGLVRTTRALGHAIALRALPPPVRGRLDLAAAPRRAFLVTWQLVMASLVSVPLVALTQPLLPGPVQLGLLVLLLAGLGVAFWRGATNLQGHARAGAEVIVAALGRQMNGSAEAAPAHSAGAGGSTPSDGGGDAQTLGEIYELIPGLGEPVSVRIGRDDHAVGRSLAELDLRDATDATVLVVVRDGESVVLPVGREVLRADDVLALAGTPEAVDRARAILRSGPAGASVGSKPRPSRTGVGAGAGPLAKPPGAG